MGEIGFPTSYGFSAIWWIKIIELEVFQTSIFFLQMKLITTVTFYLFFFSIHFCC